MKPPEQTPQVAADPPASGMLDGVRVLDLAGELGAFCGRILADLGADVVKIEPIGGDPARAAPPFAADQSGPERALSWLAANVNKRGITCNLEHPCGQKLFRALAARADVVIETETPAGRAQRSLDYASLSALNSALIVTSITPYGADGPRSTWPASDLEISASSGGVWLAGDTDRPPVRVSLPTSSGWAGIAAASGTLLALLARDLTGRGQHVDCSAQESMLPALAHAPIFWDMLSENPVRSGPFLSGRSVSGAAFRNIWPCKDGFIAFALYGGPAGRHTGKALVEWMEEIGSAPTSIRSFDWDCYDVATATVETISMLEEAIAPFFLRLTRRQFFEGVVERNMLGYPAAMMEDIAVDEQLQARDFWQELPLPWAQESSVRFPGGFALFDGVRPSIRRPAPTIGQHNEAVYSEINLSPSADRASGSRGRALTHTQQPAIDRSTTGIRAALQGLKVIEIGGFAAGPVVGKYLVNHGAEVIKIESSRRLDGFRAHYPPFKDNQPGENRAGIFNYYNDGKLSVTLNLKDERGAAIARRLTARADVLVENFTPGTLERLGLGYQALRAENPRLVMLSSCNQGQYGPHSQHAGFGTHLTSLSGFTQLLGYPDRSPVLLYGPYIDFIAVGYGVIAVLGALWRRRKTGQGCYIDLSQYETGLQLMGPPLLDLFLNGSSANRCGNRHPTAAPHGVFACAGDQAWLALSVHDEHQWGGLCQALGQPAWAASDQFGSATLRKQHEERLESCLSKLLRPLCRADVLGRLIEVGVPAYPVNSMSDLFADPQLRHRETWRTVQHPVLGAVHVLAPPFRLSDTPASVDRPGPCLSADTRSVLTEILGLSAEEVEDLDREGVLS